MLKGGPVVCTSRTAGPRLGGRLLAVGTRSPEAKPGECRREGKGRGREGEERRERREAKRQKDREAERLPSEGTTEQAFPAGTTHAVRLGPRPAGRPRHPLP